MLVPSHVLTWLQLLLGSLLLTAAIFATALTQLAVRQ
jgi:hypothetical protein